MCVIIEVARAPVNTLYAYLCNIVKSLTIQFFSSVAEMEKEFLLPFPSRLHFFLHQYIIIMFCSLFLGNIDNY